MLGYPPEGCQFRHRLLVPSRVQAALQKELVMADVQPRQVFLDAALDPLDAKLGQRHGLRRYRPGGGFRRDLRDVVTAVSPFGPRPADHARRVGFPKGADLPTPVVAGELALDAEPEAGP